MLSRDGSFLAALAVLGAASLLLRALQVTLSPLGLAADEAYYWVWSQHLDWSYFSKGPLVAYLIHLSTSIFGDTIWGVRAPAVILSTATMGLVYLLGRDVFSSPRVGFFSALVFACIPVFNVGGIIMTIDNPAFFAWAGAHWCFYHAVKDGRLRWWLGAGVFVGLGLMAKAVMFFFFPTAILYLYLLRRPQVILSRGFFFMTAISLLMFAPQVYWNLQNDFTMFKDFLRKGGAGKDFSLNPLNPFAFVGVQAGILSPLIFPGILFGMIHSLRVRKEQLVPWQFVLASWFPMVAFYLLVSLRTDVNANWTILSYALPIIGGTYLILEKIDASAASSRWRLGTIAALAGSWLLTMGLLNTQVFYPRVMGALVDRLAELDPSAKAWEGETWRAARIDPGNRLFGWEQVAEAVQEELDVLTSEGVEGFVAGRKYQVAAQLQFHLPGNPECYVMTKRGPQNQYYFINNFEKVIGKDAILVFEGADDAKRERIDKAFESLTPLRVVDVERKGLKVDEIHIVRGHHFKGWKFKENAS